MFNQTTLHSFQTSAAHSYVTPVEGGFQVVVRDADEYGVNEDTGQTWVIRPEVDRVVATERHAYLIAKFGLRKLAGPWCPADEFQYRDAAAIQALYAQYARWDAEFAEGPF